MDTIYTELVSILLHDSPFPDNAPEQEARVIDLFKPSIEMLGNIIGHASGIASYLQSLEAHQSKFSPHTTCELLTY
ncbi:hypothetical protein J2X69_000442 [Algoriphagus sp. 4150]|nr:hypothetical protein [Algoriphagus sp. 4150]